MQKLVLASGNAGKLKEFRRLLAPLGLSVLPQAELGVTEAEEPHQTFVENALAKARHAALSTGLPALADDSGLCVVALGGVPGVHSARYAGEPKSDSRNNEKLMQALEGSPERRAHYACVLVLCRSVGDPEPLIAIGDWWGEILTAPRGTGGFGYDPLFFDPQFALTAAELDLERKNRVSHRGKAMATLLELLQGQGAVLR
jgi:XTP/dITP diphosphohydrolase